MATTFVELGSGGAWPDPHRNPPAHLLSLDGDLALIDCGSGSNTSLAVAGFSSTNLTAIFLTHIHIDHCADLAPIIFGSFLTGRSKPLPVIGPPGTSGLIDALFNAAYPFANDMIRKLRDVDLRVEVREINDGETYQLNHALVTSRRVKHGIATNGYRFDMSGATVAFTGDSEPCDQIVDLARDADLLVADCAWTDEKGARPGHCIPQQLGPLAAKAGVKSVILQHMFPPCRGQEEGMVASIKQSYDGQVTVAEDQLRWSPS